MAEKTFASDEASPKRLDIHPVHVRRGKEAFRQGFLLIHIPGVCYMHPAG